MPEENDLILSVPIVKVDKEKRMVFGEATSEELDPQGDIVDFEASKAAFAEWPGNIREMHQPIAAGRAVEIVADPKTKKVFVASHISRGAESTWQKVLDGTLKYYSIGGKKLKVAIEKVGERVANRITSYRLNDLSLVDNPGGAVSAFTVIKRLEGSYEEQRDTIQHALREAYPPGPNGYSPWVVATFSDYVIAEFSDGKKYKVAYTTDSKGEVTLGDTVEVEIKQVVEEIKNMAGEINVSDELRLMSFLDDVEKLDFGFNTRAAAFRDGLIVSLDKARWTARYMNDLPDSSFAYIEAGGTKDKSGKTVPRSKRHFPIADAEGNLDAAHVRNALGRLATSPFEAKARAKVEAAAKKLGIGSKGSLIEGLEKTTFDNPRAESIKKEVLANMADKDKGTEEKAPEVKEPEVKAPETKVVVDEVKEAVASAMSPVMDLVKGLAEKVETLSKPEEPKVEKAEEPEDSGLAKVSGELKKFEEGISDLKKEIGELSERLSKVEETPAEVKAKAGYAIEKGGSELDEKGKARVSEIDAELGKLRELRTNDLAKFQAEGGTDKAFSLMKEKDAIVSAAATQ